MKREVLERIRDLRRRGWSFAGIAKQVGLTESDVVRAINGVHAKGVNSLPVGQERVSRG